MSFDAIKFALTFGSAATPAQGASGAAQLLVLIKIADFYNEEQGRAWPSVGTIGRETQLSESTVKRCIRQLESQGLLEVQQRKDIENPERNLSNFYRIPWHSGVSIVNPPPVHGEPTPGSLRTHH